MKRISNNKMSEGARHTVCLGLLLLCATQYVCAAPGAVAPTAEISPITVLQRKRDGALSKAMKERTRKNVEAYDSCKYCSSCGKNYERRREEAQREYEQEVQRIENKYQQALSKL